VLVGGGGSGAGETIEMWRRRRRREIKLFIFRQEKLHEKQTDLKLLKWKYRLKLAKVILEDKKLVSDRIPSDRILSSMNLNTDGETILKSRKNNLTTVE